MKRILLFFILTITFASKVGAIEYDKETKNKLNLLNVYGGDPSDNKIIDQGDMYLVMHNPSEFAIVIMKRGADVYCEESLGDNSSSILVKLLGKYTAFFACKRVTNNIDQYNLSEEETKCIENKLFENRSFLQDCDNLNRKNTEIIDKIKLQIKNEKKYQTNDFVYLVRNRLYDKIEKFEQAAEDKKIIAEIELEINREFKKMNAKIDKGKNQRNKLIQLHKEICIGLDFEIDSDWYNQCILNLILNNPFLSY